MVFRRMEGYVHKDTLSTEGEEPTYRVDFSGSGLSVRLPKGTLETLGVTFEGGDDAILLADVDDDASTLTPGETVTNLTHLGYMPGLDELLIIYNKVDPTV